MGPRSESVSRAKGRRCGRARSLAPAARLAALAGLDFREEDTTSDRTAQAISIRDHVIKLMEGNSKLVTLGQLKVQTWKRGRFHATLNTPFNPLHEREAAAPGYVHTIARQRAPKPMPYALHLWAGSKVLLMEWEQGGEVRIVTFKRGDWEQRVLALQPSSAS